jgi:hypothetical protein
LTETDLSGVHRFARLGAAILVAALLLLWVPGIASAGAGSPSHLPVPSTFAASATIDGDGTGTGPLETAATLKVRVAGRGGVPLSGVDAVAINVTATSPTARSFLTVWPTGKSRPNASNLNVAAGQTVPNFVMVKVGTGGQISIFNHRGTVDVIVDVVGWFPTGGSYTALTPARLLDTRPELEPPGEWCSRPGGMTRYQRVIVDPSAITMMSDFDYRNATGQQLADFSIAILKRLGPLPAKIAQSAIGWAEYYYIDVRKRPSYVDEFTNTLAEIYHEALHGVHKYDYCLSSGTTGGYRIPFSYEPSSWKEFGPAQGATYSDVMARIAALIPSPTNFCRWSAELTAKLYLWNLSSLQVWSPLIEMNAYVLEGELRSELGKFLPMNNNIGTRAAKLHQLARYLTYSKSIPGTWEAFKSLGFDRIVADHWNQEVRNWGTTGYPVECWNLAFGPDSQVIATFTNGAAGSTRPPQP